MLNLCDPPMEMVAKAGEIDPRNVPAAITNCVDALWTTVPFVPVRVREYVPGVIFVELIPKEIPCEPGIWKPVTEGGHDAPAGNPAQAICTDDVYPPNPSSERTYVAESVLPMVWDDGEIDIAKSPTRKEPGIVPARSPSVIRTPKEYCPVGVFG